MQRNIEGLRVAIYLRVSTDNQAKDGFGLDLQLSDCKAMAQIKRWIVVKVYKDKGYSGTLDENHRPGLKSLLNDAEENLFDMVIFYAMDRLGRDSLLIHNIIKQLEDNNVGIVSTREMLDSSTPQGKFVIQLFAGLAEMDRSNIVERMKKGKNELRKKKGWTGGILPYGYYMKKNLITIHKNESRILKYIFDMDCNGYNMSRIAMELNKNSIPSRMGTEWSRSTVSKIIKRKHDYEGGIINNNENNIRWPRII